MYGRRRFDGADALAVLIIGVSVLLIIIVIASAILTESDCRSKGGKMVGTGEYTQQIMMAGDAPFIYETENKECSKK